MGCPRPPGSTILCITCDSFLFAAIAKGIPAQVVMRITGHTTEREFNKYVNISDAQNAAVFRQYWN